MNWKEYEELKHEADELEKECLKLEGEEDHIMKRISAESEDVDADISLLEEEKARLEKKIEQAKKKFEESFGSKLND